MKRFAGRAVWLLLTLVAAVSAVTGFDQPAPLRQVLLYASYAVGGVVLGGLVAVVRRSP